MKTREEWEAYTQATHKNSEYFLILGTPGTSVQINFLPCKRAIWAIKPLYSSFYIAFPKSYKEALELAANCGWEVID